VAGLTTARASTLTAPGQATVVSLNTSTDSSETTRLRVFSEDSVEVLVGTGLSQSQT